ncbi:MAG: hypothetical protein AABP62_31310, partial [Planctomycetota bacterium]
NPSIVVVPDCREWILEHIRWWRDGGEFHIWRRNSLYLKATEGIGQEFYVVLRDHTDNPVACLNIHYAEQGQKLSKDELHSEAYGLLRFLRERHFGDSVRSAMQKQLEYARDVLPNVQQTLGLHYDSLRELIARALKQASYGDCIDDLESELTGIVAEIPGLSKKIHVTRVDHHEKRAKAKMTVGHDEPKVTACIACRDVFRYVLRELLSRIVERLLPQVPAIERVEIQYGKVIGMPLVHVSVVLPNWHSIPQTQQDNLWSESKDLERFLEQNRCELFPVAEDWTKRPLGYLFCPQLIAALSCGQLRIIRDDRLGVSLELPLGDFARLEATG